VITLLHENCPSIVAVKSFLYPKSGGYSFMWLEVADVAIKSFVNILRLKGAGSNLDIDRLRSLAKLFGRGNSMD
jgi:hypothetical protein